MSKWETVKLTDVCKDIFAGGDVPKDNYSLEQDDIYSIPIYTNGEQDAGLYGFTTKARVLEPSLTVSARGTIGFTAIRTVPFFPAIRLITLTPNKKIDIKYLFYVTQNYKFENGGTSIPQLTVPMLKSYSFPLPDIETQKQIAANLDKVTRTIELCNAILEKLDLLVKSQFVEMFGEIEIITDKWGYKPFSEVTDNYDNTRKPVKDADRKKMQGVYPYYGATGIVDYVNDYRIEGIYLLISEDGKALEFRNKNIAFIASGKIWVNNHAHVIQCKPNMNMIFLMYYMNFRDISSWVTGIDQKKLNRDNLDKIPVGVPPLDLQIQFAAFVEQTDKSKLAVKKVLEKAETLKKALMQEYFG